MKAIITGYMRLTDEQAKEARKNPVEQAEDIQEWLALGLNERGSGYRNNMGDIKVTFVEEE